jgi:hypothetical protein
MIAEAISQISRWCRFAGEFDAAFEVIDWDTVRSDPRFAEWVRKVGLPQ